MSIYEQRAIQWCERYGIVEYKLNKNLLVYNVSYPAYLGNPHYTIKTYCELRYNAGNNSTVKKI